MFKTTLSSVFKISSIFSTNCPKYCVHEVHQNVSVTRDGEGIEVDLLVVNDGDVVAIECKSTLGLDDVNEHLARLEKVKRLLPSYANKQVMTPITP